MAKLILLYKDFNSDLKNFEFLGDIIVHNQFPVEMQKQRVIALKRQESPVPLFEANEEEYIKMKWFAEFSQKDIVYAIERDSETCRKLILGKSAPKYKGVDIVLVYYKLRLHCLKHDSGKVGTIVDIGDTIYNYDYEELLKDLKLEHTLSRMEPFVPEPGHSYTSTFIDNYNSIREQLLMSLFQPVCEDCGISQIDVINLFIKDLYNNLGTLIPISYLMTIEEIDKWIASYDGEIFVLCRNCFQLKSLQFEELRDKSTC